MGEPKKNHPVSGDEERRKQERRGEGREHAPGSCPEGSGKREEGERGNVVAMIEEKRLRKERKGGIYTHLETWRQVSFGRQRMAVVVGYEG